MQLAFASVACCAADSSAAQDRVVVARGESVTSIVDRLVANDRERYLRVLREVLLLNRSRFPQGRAELIGEGFVLHLPAGVSSVVATDQVIATVPRAPANAVMTAIPGPSTRYVATYTTLRGDSLQSLVERWLPSQRFAQDDALTDLRRTNPSLFDRAKRTPSALLPVGTRITLPPWLATLLSTPLPPLDRKALLDGIFVPAGLAVTESTAMRSVALERGGAIAVPGESAAQSAAPEVAPTFATSPETTAIAQVTTLDRFASEQERLRKLLADKPKAYEDRVLDATAAALVARDDAAVNEDATGLRTWLGEARVGHASGSAGRASEFGLRAEYRQETLSHGEWVAQVDTRARTGDGGTSIGPLSAGTAAHSVRATLRNLGYPITTQLFADTTLGDHASEITDALARGSRAALASASVVRGLSTHWFSQDMDFRAGVGARGALAGGPYPGFERSAGELAWLGYTQRFAGGVYAGAQFSHASGVTASTATGTAGISVDAMAAAIGFGGDLTEPDSRRARLTALASQSSAASGSAGSASRHASGFFAEGGARFGAYRHEAGAYWTQPNLRFGDAAMQSDNRGAYWRVDHRGSRLFWGMGLDVDETNPTHRPDSIAQRRIGANGNFQYRIDRQTSTGGYLSFSDTRYTYGAVNGDAQANGSGARSVAASLFYQTRLMGDWGDLGRSRFTFNAKRNETIVANGVPATGQEVAWEHDWITGKYETMRPELITTLGWARDVSSDQRSTYPTAGVQWKYWADADFWVGGNLRYTSRSGNLGTSRGLSGTVNAERVFAGGWRVGLQGSINEARVETNPLTGQAPLITRSNDKWAMLYVRFEGSSGAPYQSIGLRTLGSAGAGSIRGIVYFDANRDGAQQADERGAPGVEVELDGRYRVTTDRDGRFEFPIVATGNHRITLRLDTVPLPWGASLERGLEVYVPLRGTAPASIPVVKVGE